MKKLKKTTRKLFVKLFAKKLFQPFFKKLHWIALRGMNYGGGHSPHDSGEVFFLNYVKNKLTKSSNDLAVIFDVGANMGQYALLASNIFKTNYHIHTFEPTTFCYKTLLKNTENNKNITANKLGISDSIKTTKIFYDTLGSVQSSIIKNETTSSLSETINLTTINAYCTEKKIKKINLLKLDVEGNEYNALKGCEHLLKQNNIDFIQFEFGNSQVLSRHFLSDFIALLSDYKVYRLIQNGFIEVDTNPINEIFQTSNYIAINKNFKL